MHVRQYMTELYQIAMLIDCDVIERMVDILVTVREQRGRVFFLGVGGSAANCSHAVNDMRKICGIEAYAPTDNVAELTAITNDLGWNRFFVDWVKGSNINEKDAVFVFSVGGGDVERNITAGLVYALKEAKHRGLKILGVVGRQGGYTKVVGDAVLVVPTVNPDHVTPHTEAFHMNILHCLVSHKKLQRTATTWESIHDEKLVTKIRAVAFDLEGTVVDVEFAHHEGHRAAASDVGLTMGIEDLLRDVPHFIGGPDEEIAKEIAIIAGSSTDWNYVLERMLYHYNRILESSAVEIKLRDGFLEAFQWFQDHGIIVTIGTLTPASQARVLLARSGLDRLIPADRIVLKEDVGNSREYSEVFLETARRAGVDPSEQLVFEDSPRGIEAAVEIGSIAIGMPVYHRPEVTMPLLVAGARRVFLEWGEINMSKLFTNLR